MNMDSYFETAKNPYQNYHPGSGGAGGSGTLTEPMSSSPARDRLSTAESWLSESHQALDGLEKRLDTILTPVPPAATTGAMGTQTSAPSHSHVVGRLVILNEGYEHLVLRMRRLIERVEL